MSKVWPPKQKNGKSEGRACVALNVGTSSSDYISLYNGNRETLTESLSFIRNVSADILAAVLPEKQQDPQSEK